MFLKISEGLPGCSPLNCEISWQWQDLSQELQTSVWDLVQSDQ